MRSQSCVRGENVNMASTKKGDQNETEKEIVEKIAKASVDEIKQLLSQPEVRVESLDDQGTTFLQHAAFKGRKDLCELFLQHGADVNSNYHNDGYTALMFAGLSGKPEVVLSLLQAGAKTFPINRVNKTAVEMAAFVGNHKCASVIKNFVQLSDIEYYSVAQGLEKEPKLPKHLVKPLQELLNKSYLHPVKLTYYLESHLGLLEEASKVTKVLDIMCEKSMKKTDTKDVMAIKVNYFSYILRTMAKSYIEKDKSLTPWLKSLVKGRESDGFAEKPERLIRQSMKEFPYAESELLLQFVRTVSPVAIGNEPTALSVLINCIHGRSMASASSLCESCGDPDPPKKCSACKMVHYCDVRCQKLHYPTHKKFCEKLAKEREAREELEKKMHEKEKLSKEKNATPNNGAGDSLESAMDKVDIHSTNEEEEIKNIEP